MNVKRTIVAGLNTACNLVDELAYRPAVVKLTLRFPRWWQCDLAKLSMRLDDRWGTGFWVETGPAAPGDPCDACGRRAAISTLGDERFALDLCGWCDIRASAPIADEMGLAQALAAARARSIRWAWKWRPVDV